MDSLDQHLISASAYLQAYDMSWTVNDELVSVVIYTSIGEFACILHALHLASIEKPNFTFVHYDHYDQRRGHFYLYWGDDVDADDTVSIRPRLVKVAFDESP